MRLRFQMGSVVHLDVRLYKATARGIKVVGAMLFDVSDALRNHIGIQTKQLPLGGTLVAELVLDRDAPHQSPTCARFRLSTMRLSNPEAQISETRIKVSKMIDQKGLRVKVDRFGDTILEFDTEWKWPIRVSVYDARTGVELGSCYKHLHDLMIMKKVTITDERNQIVGDVELTHARAVNTPETMLPNDVALKSSVCIAIDFTSTNGAISEPQSLHSIHPAIQMNAYHLALRKVATLFASKQTYTPWGFGATIEGKVRPIFQCGKAETVSGSDELQGAYLSFLSTNPPLGHRPSSNTFDCVIRAASRRNARVLVVLSDFLSVDLPTLLRHCDLHPTIRVILVAMRPDPLQHHWGHPSKNTTTAAAAACTLSKNVVLLNVKTL